MACFNERVAYKRTNQRTGKTYWEDVVRFPRPGGGYTNRWVRATTQRECLRLKAALIDERDSQPRGASATAKGVETVADLAALFVERHVSLKTGTTPDSYMNALELRIAPHLYRVKLRDLTTEMVETWMAHLANEQRHATNTAGEPRYDALGKPVMEPAHGHPSINVARQVLVTMLNKGKKWRYLRENPAATADKLPVIVRQVSVYHPEQIDALAIGAIRRRFDRVGYIGGASPKYCEQWAPRDVAMIYLLAYSGLRLGELLALRWMDDQGDYLRVRHSINARTGELAPTKSKRERSVPILTPAREAIEAWRTVCPDTKRGAWMFPSDRITTPLRQNTWRGRTFKEAARVAGLPEARPHELRHTFASLMIAKNVTPLRLSQWLGHSDPVTTMRRYAHLFDRVESDAVAKVNAALLS